MFGRVSEDFIRAIGRIVMLSALIEDVLASVVMTVTNDSWDQIAALPKGQLVERFDKEAKTRKLSMPLLAAISEAKQLLEHRDEVVHSLWPSEADGIASVIKQLVAVHAELRQLLWTNQVN